jgi:hypothetical protein
MQTLLGQSHFGLQRYSSVGIRNLRTPRDVCRQPTDPEDARRAVARPPGHCLPGAVEEALDFVVESGGFPRSRGSYLKRTLREVLRAFDE